MIIAKIESVGHFDCFFFFCARETCAWCSVTCDETWSQRTKRAGPLIVALAILALAQRTRSIAISATPCHLRFPLVAKFGAHRDLNRAPAGCWLSHISLITVQSLEEHGLGLVRGVFVECYICQLSPFTL